MLAENQPRFFVRLSDESDAESFSAFNQRVLFTEPGLSDPFTSSLRNELSYANDAVLGVNDFTCFLLIQMPDNEIIGRALIFPNPTVDDYDICAYSKEACEILQANTCAVLGGDIIDPQYRGKGLHELLIQKRIEWAKNQGFEYLFMPILKGNIKSLHNIQKLDVDFLGSRIFTYEMPVIVELYGRAL